MKSFQSVLELAFVVGTLLAAASCNAPLGSDKSGPPASLQIIAGNDQSGMVGKELPVALTARVLDAENRPVRGQVVNFRATAGGGSVFAGAASSNDSGLVKERWTLGTSTADSQRVEARAVDATTGNAIVFGTFKATPLPGPPAAITVHSGDNQSGTAGLPLADSLAARLTDQYGNPIPGDTLTWTVDAGNGSVNPPRSVTDASGIAKTSWTMSAATGQKTARATIGALAATFTANGSAVPASTTLSYVSGDRQTAAPGQALVDSLSVQVLDQYQNPVPGASVTWTVTGGGGSITNSSLTTGSGIARARWILGSTGNQSATASTGGVATPVYFRAGLQIGGPIQVQVSRPAGNAVVGVRVRVIAACAEPGMCDSIKVGIPRSFDTLYTNWLAAKAGGVFDDSISMAGYADSARTLRIRGFGFARDSVSTNVRVYMDSSSHLSPVDTVPGIIWDAQADRILFLQDSVGIPVLKIRNRSTRVDEVVMGETGKKPYRGDLTALGAIFLEGDYPYSATRVYEWRSGGLIDLNSQNYAISRPGHLYAVIYPGGIWRRDLLSGVNEVIPSGGNIADNGDVTWVATPYHSIYRYRGGVTERISSDTNSVTPLTDGTNVLYQKRLSPYSNQFDFAIYGPSGEVVLALSGVRKLSDAVLYRDYDARDGWVAFIRSDPEPNPSARIQVWTRSPAGEERQVSFTASSSRLAGLGPSGQVVFGTGEMNTYYGNDRYLSLAPYATATRVSSALGRVLWIGNTPHVIIGGTLLEIQ